MRRPTFRLLLADLDRDLVSAWAREFADEPEVEVVHGDLISRATNTIVSPANGFGLMDGGFDALLVERFGVELENRVMHAISQRGGELPVGAAVFVETGDATVPFLIAAPTMAVPQAVPRANAWFAMAAILKTAAAHPKVTRVCCPGLATGVGRVSPDEAAAEMASAWRKWLRAD